VTSQLQVYLDRGSLLSETLKLRIISHISDFGFRISDWNFKEGFQQLPLIKGRVKAPPFLTRFILWFLFIRFRPAFAEAASRRQV
jgi:hypothetical protein